MAETLNLRFRVLNAGVAVHEEPTLIDGEDAVIKRRRLHVDALPLDGTVQTLELELPASLEGKIVSGTILNASITFESADAQPESTPEAEA